jgi:hypothetical protein
MPRTRDAGLRPALGSAIEAEIKRALNAGTLS